MTRELRTLRERRAAAGLAIVWGYPRRIEPLEIAHGRWWDTQYGVGWLIETLWVSGVPDGDVHMHGVGRPGARRVISPELTQVVLAAARELGARRVVQPLVGEEYAGLRRLWVRAGWKLDEFGMPFMEVAGDGH